MTWKLLLMTFKTLYEKTNEKIYSFYIMINLDILFFFPFDENLSQSLLMRKPKEEEKILEKDKKIVFAIN